MKEYKVALKIFEIVKVQADSEQQAIEIIEKQLDKKAIVDFQIVEENEIK
jgi:hypothetical protein